MEEYKSKYEALLETAKEEYKEIEVCLASSNAELNHNYFIAQKRLLENLFGDDLRPKISYDDVASKLFIGKDVFRYGKKKPEVDFKDPLNCTSERQVVKLLAINKMMNVAKYLNGDWKPDGTRYYFEIYSSKLHIETCGDVGADCVFFKDRETAEQALVILGEQTIRDALSTDW